MAKETNLISKAFNQISKQRDKVKLVNTVDGDTVAIEQEWSYSPIELLLNRFVNGELSRTDTEELLAVIYDEEPKKATYLEERTRDLNVAKKESTTESERKLQAMWAANRKSGNLLNIEDLDGDAYDDAVNDATNFDYETTVKGTESGLYAKKACDYPYDD